MSCQSYRTLEWLKPSARSTSCIREICTQEEEVQWQLVDGVDLVPAPHNDEARLLNSYYLGRVLALTIFGPALSSSADDLMWNPLDRVNGTPLNVLITIASTCGFVLFGYDNGVFSGLIINPWFLDTFDHPGPSLTGIISASNNLGGFAGSVIAFFIGDALGRKRTILTGVAITAIGAIPFAAATTVAELTAGRTICGMGVGIMSSTVGLWQAETVPAHNRGAYLLAQLLYGATLGIFLAQWINYGFYGIEGRVSYAFPVAFQFIFLIVAAVLIPYLPESPLWLVKKGRSAKALQVLTRLTNEGDAREGLLQIEQSAALGNSTQSEALFTSGPTRNVQRLCLACGVMIMHQLTGINALQYYLPTLLKQFIGVPRKEALWIAGLSSVDYALATLVAIFLVDKVGRKPFLQWGALFQAIMFAIIAALLATSQEGNKSFSIAAVVMIFLFGWSFSMCWLGQSWAYPAEILPFQIREKGLALANIFYWLFQFMMVEITPVAISRIGYNFWIILAVFNAATAAVVWLLYPETARLTLAEIDLLFAHKYGRGIGRRERDSRVDEGDKEAEEIRRVGEKENA